MSGEKVFPIMQYFCYLAILLYLQMDVKTHILEGTPDQNTHVWFTQSEQTVCLSKAVWCLSMCRMICLCLVLSVVWTWHPTEICSVSPSWFSGLGRWVQPCWTPIRAERLLQFELPGWILLGPRRMARCEILSYYVCEYCVMHVAFLKALLQCYHVGRLSTLLQFSIFSELL